MRILYKSWAFISLLALYTNASAMGLENGRLEGVWVSNKSKDIYGPKTEHLKHDCLQPKWHFSDNRLTEWQKKETCFSGGKKIESSPYYKVFEIDVVGELSDTLVVKSIDERGLPKINVLHFISDTEFWMYYHGESNDARYHVRKYYRKLLDANDIEQVKREKMDARASIKQ